MCAMTQYSARVESSKSQRHWCQLLQRTAWAWPITLFSLAAVVSLSTARPISVPPTASSIMLISTAGMGQDAEATTKKDDTETRIEDLKPGREIRILRDDGKSFRGEFVSQDRLNIVIKIAGIATTFDRFRITDVIAIKTFEEQYRTLQIGISRHDFGRRLDLGQWLYGRKKYQLAAEEIEALLDDTDEFPEARKLLQTINNAISIFGPDGTLNQGAGDDEEQTARDLQDPTRFVEGMLLTDEQINLLRIYEVDLDNPPRMIVSRATLDRLLDRYADHELIPKTDSAKRNFYARDAAQILDLMFDLQARDLYGEIRVLSEPTAFIKFRMDVQRTWLTNSCATSRCHGGPDAGDLYLFNKRANHSRTVYTNFLILERSRIDGDTLLNYDRPSESLLLQMGLPRNQTSKPHPNVAGWRPIFRDRTDPIYLKAVEWMNSMYQPRPDYPVEFKLPKIGQHEPDPGESNGNDNEDGPAIDAGVDLVEDGADGGG